MNNVKALFFDVFGTLVDWRTGVAREAESILKPLGYTLDWSAFADAWRDQYQPGMEEVRSGRLPYAKLDVLHKRMLQKIVPAFGLDEVADRELNELTLAWHRLDAWQDVPRGLARLRERFLIAPVSNGNIALMSDLARRNDFRWDAILGADIARDFKPKAALYLTAVDAFNLRPGECMMCAAHGSDLMRRPPTDCEPLSLRVRRSAPATAKPPRRCPPTSCRIRPRISQPSWGA